MSKTLYKTRNIVNKNISAKKIVIFCWEIFFATLSFAGRLLSAYKIKVIIPTIANKSKLKLKTSITIPGKTDSRWSELVARSSAEYQKILGGARK